MNKSVKMILTNSFDPDVRVLKEAKYLISKGYDVEILCWDRDGRYQDKSVEIYEKIRISRYYIPSTYGSGIKQIIPYFRFMYLVHKKLSNQYFQFLHCHDLDGAIIGSTLNNKNIIKIFDMHEIYGYRNGLKNKIKNMVLQILYKNFDKYLYVTEKQLELLPNKFKGNMVYLPNYPILSNYNFSLKERSEKVVISYIGVVRQYNELKNLILSCEELLNVDIKIHGYGVSYNELYQEFKHLSNVEITGQYNTEESNELFAQTDVLYCVYPANVKQYNETIPVKFFEAIATNTPIIVNKGSKISGIVEEYNIGFSIEPNNILELKSTINQILLNPNILNDKKANLLKLRDKYSWESISSNLDHIY